MVSLITEGSATDSAGRPFRRRRNGPWLALIAVLALICTVAWTKALTMPTERTTEIACNSPSPPKDTHTEPVPALGQRVSTSHLHDVEPAALADTQVRVRNANNKRGQAANIAAQLGDLGFGSVPGKAFDNDSIYVNGDLDCSGQIRFGVHGRRTAAAVQLVAPCAELIEDERPDATVDLVLGYLIGEDIHPNNDAEAVLRSLKNPAQSDSPAIDIELLEAARSARC